MGLRILLVGLDSTTHDQVATALLPHGLLLHPVASVEALPSDADMSAYDVAVLHLGTTGNARELARQLREQLELPVVMLVKSADEAGTLLLEDAVVDDCLALPFHPRELHGRLQAVVRRVRASADRQRLSSADIMVDVFARRVWVGGEPVGLTGVEFDVLVALLREPGRVVRREELLAKAGRSDVSVGERTVDVHIAHLRRKIGDRRDGTRRIETVRGIGYVLTAGAGRAEAELEAQSGH